MINDCYKNKKNNNTNYNNNNQIGRLVTLHNVHCWS